MVEFLFGCIVVFIALRLAVRFLFPALLVWWIRRNKDRFYQQNSSDRPHPKEGETRIDYIPPKEDLEKMRPPAHTSHQEDYVEYEEVENPEKRNRS